LAVTVGGMVGGLATTNFGGIGTDSPKTCNATAAVNPKNCFEWSPVNQTATYDLASRLVSVNAPGNTWTGTSGLFDGMTCRAGSPTAIACVDADGDGKCEFNTTAF